MNCDLFQGVVYSLISLTYLHRAFDRGMENATHFQARLRTIHMPAQILWGFPSLVVHLCPYLLPYNVSGFVVNLD